jgi:hypothetical protein
MHHPRGQSAARSGLWSFAALLLILNHGAPSHPLDACQTMDGCGGGETVSGYGTALPMAKHSCENFGNHQMRKQPRIMQAVKTDLTR